MSQGAGVFMQAFGAGTSANATRESGRYNKEIADYNAQIAEYQSQDAIVRGDLAANRQRTAVKGMIGAQRASLAAQGIDPNAGSAVDVQAGTAYMGEVDAMMIRNNAAREAWGYKVQAWNSTEQGKIAEKTADSKAFSTLLGAAGNIALKKYGFGSSSSTAPNSAGGTSFGSVG